MFPVIFHPPSYLLTHFIISHLWELTKQEKKRSIAMAEEGTKVPIKMKPESADKNHHVFPSSEKVVDALAKEEIAKHFPIRSEFQSPTTTAPSPPTPDLVNLSMVPSIIDLLNHDNTNIAIDVVQLLQDLTNEDVLDDNDDSAKFLVEALVDNSVLELLVQNLHRFSDSNPDKTLPFTTRSRQLKI